jgi:hypothetical protein
MLCKVPFFFHSSFNYWEDLSEQEKKWGFSLQKIGDDRHYAKTNDVI